jgi:hypothetical protein
LLAKGEQRATSARTKLKSIAEQIALKGRSAALTDPDLPRKETIPSVFVLSNLCPKLNSRPVNGFNPQADLVHCDIARHSTRVDCSPRVIEPVL